MNNYCTEFGIDEEECGAFSVEFDRPKEGRYIPVEREAGENLVGENKVRKLSKARAEGKCKTGRKSVP